MTTIQTNPQENVGWAVVSLGWATAVGRAYPLRLCFQPDMTDDDRFLVTVDGPRGGEYASFNLTRKDLLELIVAADKERERVTIVRQDGTP